MRVIRVCHACYTRGPFKLWVICTVPWLVAYFDPLFKALKQLLKVQERTFCSNSTNSFTLKDCRIAAIFIQHNTDDLAMFILYVTSACDKFPISLH